MCGFCTAKFTPFAAHVCPFSTVTTTMGRGCLHRHHETPRYHPRSHTVRARVRARRAGANCRAAQCACRPGCVRTGNPVSHLPAPEWFHLDDPAGPVAPGTRDGVGCRL